MQAFDYMRTTILPYNQHIFVRDWQAQQERYCVAHLTAEPLDVPPDGMTLPRTSLCTQFIKVQAHIHCDFSAIHQLKVHKGIQEHYRKLVLNAIASHGTSVSLNLASVAHLLRDGVKYHPGYIVRLFFTALTNDTKQDPATVWAALSIVKRTLLETYGVLLVGLDGSGDNCGDQYKHKLAIAFLGYHSWRWQLLITWNFGQARHGKGDNDAACSMCASRACDFLQCIAAAGMWPPADLQHVCAQCCDWVACMLA